MAPRARTGDDPIRTHPAGSRTETRIAEESELGSDGADDGAVVDEHSRPAIPAPRRRRRPGGA
jgi:hypothetical protein